MNRTMLSKGDRAAQRQDTERAEKRSSELAELSAWILTAPLLAVAALTKSPDREVARIAAAEYDRRSA
jgi:hypothetical protein